MFTSLPIRPGADKYQSHLTQEWMPIVPFFRNESQMLVGFSFRVKGVLQYLCFVHPHLEHNKQEFVH